MTFAVDALLAHPKFHEVLMDQTLAFLDINTKAPKLASIFGTHQRWMLAHLAMAQYFLDAASGATEPVIVMARFLEQVRRLEISSINTADAFVKEMLVYGIAVQSTADDRRHRPVIPAPHALAGLRQWIWIHLRSLDCFDGGRRADTFELNEALAMHLHPALVQRLLASEVVRFPPPRYALFTWLNSGGIVMDWLMMSIQTTDNSASRFMTQVRSVPQLAERFRVSRTHLTRKLREAEDLGSIGWLGKRGRSTMWISKEFRQEYNLYQAQKLSLIEETCETCGLR